jgi:short-subunit dehydrogenase
MFDANTPATQVALHYASQIKSKYFIITGSNQGLACESAKKLLRNGGIVTICSRNTKKGQNAIELLRKEIPDAQVLIND